MTMSVCSRINLRIFFNEENEDWVEIVQKMLLRYYVPENCNMYLNSFDSKYFFIRFIFCSLNTYKSSVFISVPHQQS